MMPAGRGSYLMAGFALTTEADAVVALRILVDQRQAVCDSAARYRHYRKCPVRRSGVRRYIEG